MLPVSIAITPSPIPRAARQPSFATHTVRFRQPRRREPIRLLSVEPLEQRVVLNGDSGFIDTPGGFAYQITGTEFQFNANTPAEPDNLVIWQAGGGPNPPVTNFFLEWVDDGGIWQSTSDTVGSGDIADEAEDRGLLPGDFEGFFFKGLGGNDLVRSDGGTFLYDTTVMKNNDTQFESHTTCASKDGNCNKGIRSGAPEAVQEEIDSPFGNHDLTINGDTGDDDIFASPGADTIRGGTDNDEIVGSQGDDIIFGGAGNDAISAGDGNDNVFGDEGNDRLLGDDGEDMLRGGGGNDTLRGNSDNDRLIGDGGDDQIFGDGGNDQIEGGGGRDLLLGNGGNDLLSGDDGDDEIYGGNGSDDIDGGEGDDQLAGGMKVNGFTTPDTTTNLAGSPINNVFDDFDFDAQLNLEQDGSTSTDLPDGAPENGTMELFLSDGDSASASFMNGIFNASFQLDPDGVGITSFEYGGNSSSSFDVLDNGGNSGFFSDVRNVTGDWSVTTFLSDKSGETSAASRELDEDDSNSPVMFDFEDFLDNVDLSNLNSFGLSLATFSPGGSSIQFANFGTIGSGPTVNDNNPMGDYVDGDDTIRGGLGNDRIRGDGGSDELIGNQGNDTILGDDIDKNPTGGEGTDKFHAGPTTRDGINIENSDLERIDTTGWNRGDPNDLQNGRFNTNANDAFGEFKDPLTGDFFAFSDNVDSTNWIGNATRGVEIITGAGNDTVIGSDIGQDLLYPGINNNNANNGIGENSLGIVNNQTDSRNDADTIMGLGGSDQIFGGNDNDLLQGGDGNDILDGGTGIDAQSGGQGQDVIMSEYGSLQPSGEEESFTYDEGSGDGSDAIVDLLDSDSGFLFGNEGSDNFTITGTNGSLDEFDTLSELAAAESFGISDFENNADDLLEFIRDDSGNGTGQPHIQSSLSTLLLRDDDTVTFLRNNDNDRLDFGDAPDSYATRLATGPEGGARHATLGPRLGLLRDGEGDAAEALDGSGDDVDFSEDEDGVAFSALRAGVEAIARFDLRAGAGSARVYAWIDFDGSGAFDDNEQIADGSATLPDGISQIGFSVPFNSQPGTTFARFRVTTDEKLGADGLASDGEVEDYALTIAPPPPVVAIEEVSPSERLQAVSEITITFSEAVQGFDLADLALQRDGQDIQLAPTATLATDDNITWTLAGLENLTDRPGSFQISLDADESGVANSDGVNLLMGDEVNWTDLRQAGDSNLDRQFDQFDLILALQGAKYRKDEFATWAQGDWNGDGRFDQFDVIASLQTMNFRQGPYVAFAMIAITKHLDFAELADQIFASDEGLHQVL